MEFRQALLEQPVTLAEGAVIERVRRDPSVELDPHVLHAGFVYQSRAGQVLAGIYGGYLDVGQQHDLPMITLTPTWRASPDRLARAGLADLETVNVDCARFLLDIVRARGAYGRKVFVGGLMGCAGDAYDPGDALPSGDAARFHAGQAKALAGAGVAFLMAATLPAFSESLGMAKAMARCGLPYVLSFVLRPWGTLLDGTPLHEAVERIDAAVSPAPFCYMANCVHPTVFAKALVHEINRSPGLEQRVLGLQANTSPRSPEELDELEHLDSEEPRVFADAMLHVHQALGTRVLGGCCGTDDRHIAAIADRVRI